VEEPTRTADSPSKNVRVKGDLPEVRVKEPVRGKVQRTGTATSPFDVGTKVSVITVEHTSASTARVTLHRMRSRRRFATLTVSLRALCARPVSVGKPYRIVA